VRSHLVTGLKRGRFPEGSRFLSNRALAERYGVSCQTADRLIRELCAEGWLIRRPSSGTYVRGGRWKSCGAHLCFHGRARRSGSFGARLFDSVAGALRDRKVPYRATWERLDEEDEVISTSEEDHYAVCWEAGAAVERESKRWGRGLILNDLPPSLPWGAGLDSVAVDDRAGGLGAANLLLELGVPITRCSVLGGPEGDHRSQARVEGFSSLIPCPTVSAGWHLTEGMAGATRVLDLQPLAVFCANDRLAEAMVRRARQRAVACPYLVGFDDAPIAQRLGLSTMAIPWDELASAVGDIVSRRMTDREGAAMRVQVLPHPVIRGERPQWR
jgi:hypothetical protein